jgi:hypothetical protein
MLRMIMPAPSQWNWIAKGRFLDVGLFMAGCLSIGLRVHNAGFATYLSLGSMVAHGLHAALLPRLSDLFFRDRRPGIWAALVAILLPVPRFFPRPEGIFCAVGLMLFCLATDRRLSRGGTGGALFTGLFAGALTLLNPLCPMVCGFWLLYLLWRRRVAFAAKSLPLIALAFVATLAPLFFMRDSLGRELGIFWFVNAEGFRPLRGFSIALLTVGAFLGSALMARRRTPVAMLLAAVPVAYPAIYDFVRIDAHYRAPILWASLLGTGYLLSSAVAAVSRRPAVAIESNIPELHVLK